MNNLNYVRPSQVRKIPPKAPSYRGMITAVKLNSYIKTYTYFSGLQRDFYVCLDHDIHCIKITPPSEEIAWTDKNGKEQKACPDCLAEFSTGEKILFFVKSIKNLQELNEDDNWNLQYTAIENHCKGRGLKHKIFDESHIRTPRLENIMLFRGEAQHPPSYSVIEKIKDVLPYIYQKKIGISFKKLIEEIERITGISSQTVSHVVQYLLFYQFLYFEWDKFFHARTTQIYLNLRHEKLADPFYNVEPIEQKNESPEPIEVDVDLTSISPEQEKEINDNHEAIRPLLNLPNRTRKDVEDRGTELEMNPSKLYRLIKRYEKEGWKGLIHKYHKRGNRESRFPDEVKEIIEQRLKEYLNSQMSEKGCWEKIRDDCIKKQILYQVGKKWLRYPHLNTIRRLVHKLPAKERKGKLGGFNRFPIPQTVVGNLKVGIKPGDFWQQDHIQSDIELVDPATRKPAGRPWVTTITDTTTRMLCGYFMSYDHPDSVSVMRALQTAILPKDELLKEFGIEGKWPIQGIPKKIQFDNALEFRSNHTERFCKLYRINPEFRPVLTPETAGIIERFHGTLNRRIRDDAIKGYAAPLKNRPESNNPEKEALNGSMTIREYEKWFLLFIVEEYHMKPHDGLEPEIPPLAKYLEGIKGNEEIPGATPSPLVDVNELMFDMLPEVPEAHRLNHYGIQWENNRYNEYVNLPKMRARNQGESVYVKPRYDPKDIRRIWIRDAEAEVPFYFSVPLKTGFLAEFIRKNPDIPIGLSESKQIRKNIIENYGSVNQYSSEAACQKRFQHVKDCEKKTRAMRKSEEKKRQHLDFSKKVTENADKSQVKTTEESKEFIGKKDTLLPPPKKLFRVMSK